MAARTYLVDLSAKITVEDDGRTTFDIDVTSPASQPCRLGERWEVKIPFVDVLHIGAAAGRLGNHIIVTTPTESRPS